MSKKRPSQSLCGALRWLSCSLCIAQVCYSDAFSSQTYAYPSLSVSRKHDSSQPQPIHRVEAHRSPELFGAVSDRHDTGHDRRKLQQTQLSIFAEYQRAQRILSQHCRKDTTRLQQAILCGYVTVTVTSSDAPAAGDGLERFERLFEQGPRAREVLITSNMGLVRHVVETVLSSYCHLPQQQRTTNAPKGSRLLYSLTRQDLIQEGTIGLARAIDKYDASFASSTAFSTYAYYWIRAAVLRAIAQKDQLVRVPEHVSSAISKIVRAANRLGLYHTLDTAQSLQQDMMQQYHSFTSTLPLTRNTESTKWEDAETAKRLADEAGVSLSLLKDALRVQQQRQASERLGGALSLEPWMMASSSTLDNSPHLEQDMFGDDIRDSLSQYVNRKEMEALCLRYGLVKPQQPAGFRDYEAETERELYGDSSTGSTASNYNNNNNNNNKVTAEARRKPVPVGGRWGEAMSFSEIGHQMQISAEYGRRLCSSALKKLKQAADDGRLDPSALIFT